MKRLMLVLAAACVLATGVVAPTLADSSKMMSSATVTCPACGMAMTLSKTSMNTVPIYLKAKKKVYYCCAGCKTGASAAAYYKKHGKPMKV